jgi:hypothetical protein
MCELEGKENYKKQIFGYAIVFAQKWCLSWVLEKQIENFKQREFWVQLYYFNCNLWTN